MIPGTGPGRGVPWWRRFSLIRVRYVPGYRGSEPIGQVREGRLIVRS